MTLSDEDSSVVAECLKGDKETFGILVQRYQSLVCGLIYSRCGNVAQSEDLAQETFVAAWNSLSSLREPAHFKAWLCQIARNVSANSARTLTRKREGHRVTLDALPGLVDHQPGPAADAIEREEEKLVWHALETLPEKYRLPLILFHREGESIAAVASALDLSEDAVKQRLARGRKLLKCEVNKVVEGTLARTKPGPAFTAATVGGLGALGATSAKAATVGTMTVGTAAVAKSVPFASVFWLGIVPLVGEWMAWFLVQKKTQNLKERAVFRTFAITGSLITLAFTGWLVCLRKWTGDGSVQVVPLIISSVFFCVARWGLAFVALRRAGWLGPSESTPTGRTHRKGYAPGWQVRCPKCNLTVDAGLAGLIRVGAIGSSRRLGPCSRCGKFRWLIIERTKS